MIPTIMLGIVSSTLAEVVTALNKRLSGTVLAGDAAFLVAFGMALVGAAAKEMLMPGFKFSDLGNVAALTKDFTEVFTVSQLYFLVVVQKLNLDVQQSAPAVATGAAI